MTDIDEMNPVKTFADLAGELNFYNVMDDDSINRLREALWALLGEGKSEAYDIPDTEVKFLDEVQKVRKAFERWEISVLEFVKRMAIVAGDREAELRKEQQDAGVRLDHLYLRTESQINRYHAKSLPIDNPTYSQFIGASFRKELNAEKGIDVDAEVKAMLEARETPGYFLDLALCRVANIRTLVLAVDRTVREHPVAR